MQKSSISISQQQVVRIIPINYQIYLHFIKILNLELDIFCFINDPAFYLLNSSQIMSMWSSLDSQYKEVLISICS